MGPEDILHSSGTVSQPGHRVERLLQVALNFQYALWLGKLPGATFSLGWPWLWISPVHSMWTLHLGNGFAWGAIGSACPPLGGTPLGHIVSRSCHQPSCHKGLEDILHSGWGSVSASLSGRGKTRLLCCSDTKLCPTICDYMDCSMPGFPVFHCLPEFSQTQVHWVGDAIQPSHPLSPPSPLALNLSQHRHLFQWVVSCFENSVNSKKRQARL